MSHSYILELQDESEATSTAAECMSVLAMVSLSVSIAKFFGLNRGKVEVYCDNDEALELKLGKWLSYTKYCGNDVDLVIEIKALVG